MKKIALLVCVVLAFSPVKTHAETPEEWIHLGHRVHGDFGTYIALGIRVGLDAMKRLKAEPRELDVTYQDGSQSPCPCVVDGIMIATVSTPGQKSLRVLPAKSGPTTLGIIVIKHKKTGESLRYTLFDSARSLLNAWNKGKTERERYNVVMNAPKDSLFRVEVLPKPRALL